MNQLIELLWETIEDSKTAVNKEYARVQSILYTGLSPDLAQKLRENTHEIATCAARAAFERGLCLGGQLLLAMDSADFTPS